MQTLNQLLAAFRDVATRHQQINDYFVGSDALLDAKEDLKYPVLMIYPTSATIPKTDNGYSAFNLNFAVKVLDQPSKNDEDTNIEILSDGVQILKDIITEFNNHPYYFDNDFNIVNDLSFNAITFDYENDLSGWSVDVVLSTPNRNTFCGSPIGAIPDYNIEVPSVTVIDGVNTYTFFYGDEYTCEPLAPLNVSNSNDSYSINTVIDVELPNIDFTDSDGTTVSVPSMEDITATLCPVKSGIKYERDYYRPNNTSYRAYDESWLITNGILDDYTEPTNPVYSQKLDVTTDPTGRTLFYNNAFGNKLRFTDASGSAVVPVNGQYIVDNLTGLGHYDVTSGYYTGSIDNWLGVGGLMEQENNSNFLGYNDWFLQTMSIANKLLGYANISGSAHLLPRLNSLNLNTWTSTPRLNVSAHHVYAAFGGWTDVLSASSTSPVVLMTRIHFK